MNTWNLNSIFPNRKSFADFLSRLSQQIEQISAFQNLEEAISLIQELQASLKHASSYVDCLVAQNIDNSEALVWQHKVTLLSSEFEKKQYLFDQFLANLEEKFIDMQPADLQFPLNERRKKIKEKLKPELEYFLQDLSIDGYHGWAHLHKTLIGELLLPFKGKEYSFGQMENFLSHQDRTVRKEAFQAILIPLKQQQHLFAQTLNHLAGFRIETYKKRGWNVLKEPLDYNRMTEKTLNAMWEAIHHLKTQLLPFFEKKALLLKIPKLSWVDLDSPLGDAPLEYSYEEAKVFILDNFGRFSPKMAAFARRAFDEKWIEAEDRPKKAPGGFCTEFPLKKETRIFMTYSNTFSNLSTLAHELGHAFHSHICFDLPTLAQDYRMNVAETASTMAEMIVIDAALEQQKDTSIKMALLNDKIQRSITFLMNIQARFIFETEFYAERQKGYVLPENLCTLMLSAQKKAYLNALDEWHPYFWASKMHFYFTDVPFYNFPYTFGYLFSLGIYTHLKQKKNPEELYIALLKDTGKIPVEQLAKKHLQVDLEKTAFWENAVQSCVKDVYQFLDLCKK